MSNPAAEEPQVAPPGPALPIYLPPEYIGWHIDDVVKDLIRRVETLEERCEYLEAPRNA